MFLLWGSLYGSVEYEDLKFLYTLAAQLPSWHTVCSWSVLYAFVCARHSITVNVKFEQNKCGLSWRRTRWSNLRETRNVGFLRNEERWFLSPLTGKCVNCRRLIRCSNSRRSPWLNATRKNSASVTTVIPFTWRIALLATCLSVTLCCSKTTGSIVPCRYRWIYSNFWQEIRFIFFSNKTIMLLYYLCPHDDFHLLQMPTSSNSISCPVNDGVILYQLSIV